MALLPQYELEQYRKDRLNLVIGAFNASCMVVNLQLSFLDHAGNLLEGDVLLTNHDPEIQHIRALLNDLGARLAAQAMINEQKRGK